MLFNKKIHFFSEKICFLKKKYYLCNVFCANRLLYPNMKKKFVLFLALSLGVMMSATEVVFMTSSQSIRYVVESDIEKMSFSDSTLLITKNDVSIELCLDSLQKWYFDNIQDNLTSLNEIMSSDVEITQIENTLTIKNTDGTKKAVSFCSVSGIVLLSSQPKETLQIDLSSMAPGVYVLNVGNDSFKILNK